MFVPSAVWFGSYDAIPELLVAGALELEVASLDATGAASDDAALDVASDSLEATEEDASDVASLDELADSSADVSAFSLDELLFFDEDVSSVPGCVFVFAVAK